MKNTNNIKKQLSIIAEIEEIQKEIDRLEKDSKSNSKSNIDGRYKRFNENNYGNNFGKDSNYR